MGSSSGGMQAQPAGTSYPQQAHMDAANKLLGMGALSMLSLPTLRGESLNQYQVNPLHYAAMQALMQAPRTPAQPPPPPSVWSGQNNPGLDNVGGY